MIATDDETRRLNQREYRRKYYQTHRFQSYVNCTSWGKRNPEKLREYDRRRREKNKERDAEIEKSLERMPIRKLDDQKG